MAEVRVVAVLALVARYPEQLAFDIRTYLNPPCELVLVAAHE